MHLFRKPFGEEHFVTEMAEKFGRYWNRGRSKKKVHSKGEISLGEFSASVSIVLKNKIAQFRSLSERKFFERTINNLQPTHSPQVIDSSFGKIYLRQALRLTPFPKSEEESQKSMSKSTKKWNVPLKEAGFIKEGSVFVRRGSEVEQTISAKKNLHDTTFQILATVGIKDPFEEPKYQQQHVFWGYVYPNALHFFSVKESWWQPERLAGAIDAIVSFALPWLNDHFTLEQLLFDVEHCIGTPQSWQDYFEKKQASSRPWNAIYRHASLLHMKLGNKEASCKRAFEWLNFVKASKDSEPGRTIRQMQHLGCTENAQIAALLSEPVSSPKGAAVS